MDRPSELVRASALLEGFFLVALVMPFAEAATLRVPQDYATIQTAVRAARSEDTIEIAPGIYQETVDVSVDRTAETGPVLLLTLAGQGMPGQIVIQGSFAFRGGPQDTILLSNLMIRGPNTQHPDRSGVAFSGGERAVLLNCVVEGYDAAGVSVDRTNLTISGSLLQANRDGLEFSAYGPTRVEVFNSLIVHNDQTGVGIGFGGSEATGEKTLDLQRSVVAWNGLAAQYLGAGVRITTGALDGVYALRVGQTIFQTNRDRHINLSPYGTQFVDLGGNIFRDPEAQAFVSGLSDATVSVGETLVRYIEATDAEQDRLTYSGVDLPAGATLETVILGDTDAPSSEGYGVVGGADSNRLRAHFGARVGDPAYDPACDLDSNGVIGGSDFTLLRANFGKSLETPGAILAGRLTWTPASDQVGEHTLTIVVSDGVLTTQGKLMIAVQ